MHVKARSFYKFLLLHMSPSFLLASKKGYHSSRTSRSSWGAGGAGSLRLGGQGVRQSNLECCIHPTGLKCPTPGLDVDSKANSVLSGIWLAPELVFSIIWSKLFPASNIFLKIGLAETKCYTAESTRHSVLTFTESNFPPQTVTEMQVRYSLENVGILKWMRNM